MLYTHTFSCTDTTAYKHNEEDHYHYYTPCSALQPAWDCNLHEFLYMYILFAPADYTL